MTTPSQQPPTERQLDTAITDRMAAELRRDGKTYRQIADAMGWASTASAYGAVKRALREVVREAGAEVLAFEVERLDQLVDDVRTIMKTTDSDMTKLMCVDRLTKLSETRRKLLGVDAPTKVEARITDSVDAQIEQLAYELGQVESMSPVNADH